MENNIHNETYIGVVEDNNDPNRTGRVKIRVLDIYDDFEVENIPWATPWKDLNGNANSIPDLGKVMLVVFDQGDKYKPEFISSEHYNINLENKMKKISNSDYLSMKSLLFDHSTQIYVNETEGLKLDHKYNNINITKSDINLNIKDNNGYVNIGDATAGQQAILGNHWMDWFDEFVDNLLGNQGGPYLGNMGAPVVANPALIGVLQKYKALKEPKFLSHHVNIVDNNKVSTVKNEDREDIAQIGDKWVSSKVDNVITKQINTDYKPSDGLKENYNAGYVANETTASGEVVTKKNDNPVPVPLSSIKSNPIIDRLFRYMKSKGYVVYETPNILNIVGMRGKDDGVVSNIFDDILYMFYINDKGNWELMEYQITTTPGFIPKTSELPEGVSILSLGQYVDQYILDVYVRDVEYSYLKSGENLIHINDRKDSYNYNVVPKRGNYSININRTDGTSENVNNWSKGDQVFKRLNQYDQFISLCEKQVKLANKDKFTYTLCKKSEFDLYQ